MAAGTVKIPVPTIPPTTIATVADSPRRSSGAARRSSAAADTSGLRDPAESPLLAVGQGAAHAAPPDCAAGADADDDPAPREYGGIDRAWPSICPPASKARDQPMRDRAGPRQLLPFALTRRCCDRTAVRSHEAIVRYQSRANQPGSKPRLTMCKALRMSRSLTAS